MTRHDGCPGRHSPAKGDDDDDDRARRGGGEGGGENRPAGAMTSTSTVAACVVAVVLGVVLGVGVVGTARGEWNGGGATTPTDEDGATTKKTKKKKDGVKGASRDDARVDVLRAVGNTPVTRVESLSALTGCEVYVKCEFLNPGGSVKDRVALRIVQDALRSGELKRGGVVTEGTAGSTGVSLAMVCKALGVECFVAMPDDAALEKSQLVQAYGARVERVRPVSIANRGHFVNVARRAAESARAERGEGGGYFADQFENLANFRAHREGTGREIYEQIGDELDAFVCACGTGGTLAGVGAALKERNPSVQLFLADPQGSGLFNRVVRGVMYTKEEAEGKRLRNPFDSVTEGVGINRVTDNFRVLLEQPDMLDGAVKVTDAEAVAMSRFVAKHDGLFIGSSSAVNLVAAVRVARFLGPGHRVCTIACDSGLRHMTKFWSDDYLARHDLTPPELGEEPTLAFLDDANAGVVPARGIRRKN